MTPLRPHFGAISILSVLILTIFATNANALTTGQAAAIVFGQGNFTGNGAIAVNTLNHPDGFAFDPQGNLWIADSSNNRILEYKTPFSTGEAPSVVLGQRTFVNNATGSTTANTLNIPSALAFDPQGNLWIADSSNNRTLEFPTANLITGGSANVVIGQTGFGATSTGNTANTLNNPHALAFDPSGNLWVADGSNHRILKPPVGNLITNGFANVVIGQTGFGSGAPAHRKHPTWSRRPHLRPLKQPLGGRHRQQQGP